MDDAEDTPIEAAWERIEDWLAENAPFTLLTLNEGATERDIWAAQSALGFPLPGEIAESYRIHNGQGEGLLMNKARFGSLVDMAAEYQRLYQEEFKEGGTWWKPQWLPLAANESGDCYCLDTASGLPVPPVILLLDSGGVESIATSFTQWLQQFADALETENYKWSGEYDDLVPIEYAE